MEEEKGAKPNAMDFCLISIFALAWNLRRTPHGVFFLNKKQFHS